MSENIEIKEVNEEATASTEVNDEGKSFKRFLTPYRKASMRVCKNCGRFYVLPDSDAVYFVQKFGQLPLRCEKCREISKKYREEHGDESASTEEVTE